MNLILLLIIILVIINFKIGDLNIIEGYKQLNNMMLGMRALGNVVIPQVIVSDKTAGIAGMVDILVIKPDGSLTIIDLKASKNHMTSDRYMKEMYPVNEGSIFYDSSKPKDQQMKMTTKMQHGIQVGLYRRIPEIREAKLCY